MRPAHLLRSLVTLVAIASGVVKGFSFNTSTPTQCGQWTVSWDGGTGPFFLVLVPTITVNSGRILNISIPTSVTAPYSYTFQLSEPSGLQFLATMYDSTGWGSGGTTDVLTVGSGSDSSCLDNNLLYDFYFSTNPQSNPSQCSSMSVTWESNVTYPVHLYGVIPHGTAFSLPIAQTSSQISYDWTVDIASGTEFVLLMSDSGQYQTGGSTGLLTVSSGNTNCMNSSSPASVTTSASSTGSGSSTATGSASASASNVAGQGGSSGGGSSEGNSGSGSSSGGGGSKTGAIVGGVLGGVAFLVLLLILLFCCVRRRAGGSRRGSDNSTLRSYGISSGSGSEAGEKRRRGPLDILAGRSSGDAEGGGGEQGSPTAERQVEVNGDVYQPSPFRYPSPPDTPEGGATGRPGAGTGAGAGAGAGVGAGMLSGAAVEKAREAQQASDGRGAGVPASTDPSRPSVESQGTTTTSGLNSSAPGSGTGGGNGNVLSGQHPSPPSAYAPTAAAASDAATVGHAPARQSSISKAGRGSVPATPTATTAGHGGRPLPDVPSQRETRYVQHEDAGEVVDLPPRYDQLRAQNPD